ncbi:MAG: cell division protein ZapA [Bdellovibrionales bacterium]|nr:cell division protein ZapA [Bdellovibrionales bacterium]
MDVKILGKTYAVKSEYDEQFALDTAGLVDRRIRELSAKVGPVSTERIAILAALNFAGELLQMKQKSKDRDQALVHKLSRISKLLESMDKNK